MKDIDESSDKVERNTTQTSSITQIYDEHNFNALAKRYQTTADIDASFRAAKDLIDTDSRSVPAAKLLEQLKPISPGEKPMGLPESFVQWLHGLAEQERQQRPKPAPPEKLDMPLVEQEKKGKAIYGGRLDEIVMEQVDNADFDEMLNDTKR